MNRDLTEKQLIWITLFGISLILFGLKCLGEGLEYIPSKQRANLSNRFDEASPLKIASGNWICDMYGVQSHVQVEKGLHLYAFQSQPRGALNNAGSSFVHTYSLRNGELLGSNRGLTDMVRKTGQNGLISRLTQDKTGSVIAYSLCTRSP